jgi:hypothetical protein
LTEPHPAHAAIITIAGRDHRVRSTFRLSIAVEEHIGSVFSVAKDVISGACEVSTLGDLLLLMLPEITEPEIDAYFDEAGIAGVRVAVAGVLTQMLRGWRALSAEAEASKAATGTPETGDEPRPLPPRKGPGRPRGARNKPKEMALSPGETSSAAPADSASDPATSGSAPPSNLPPSGLPQSQNPPPLTNGLAVETPASDQTCAPSTALFPGI